MRKLTKYLYIVVLVVLLCTSNLVVNVEGKKSWCLTQNR